MTDEAVETTDWYKHWTDEFSAAKKSNDKWQKNGKKVVKKFLDDRTDSQDDFGYMERRINLFHSNIVTLMAMLYGNTPKVEVDRTFSDPSDDVARVASEMLTRMLTQDIQFAGENQVDVLRSALQDRLLPGLGTARVAYNFESETSTTDAVHDEDGNELAPEVKDEKVTSEWVDILYVHWRDYLWSPARTYGEIRWRAFRSYLSKAQATKRFGAEIAAKLTYTSKGPVNTGKGNDGKGQAINQTEVWEIWDKTTETVFWFVEGFPKILDRQDDPLELDQFFPDPPPMIANVTTTKWEPRADYLLAQDLYDEIDKLQTRISYLTDACKCVGVYDKAQEGVKRIFTEGVENDLIPVDNWAQFGEKNGLQGVIDWVPIEAVVKTIEVLTEKQGEKIQQLYQVTGMSDIMRGSSQPYEAAATSKEKVKYASIRVQCLQDEFARFASDLQSLKVEIIRKHFQPYCIIEQSNIMNTDDAAMAEQAVQFIKGDESAKWRIKIRPESLAMADYAQIKADRMEYINGLAMFMQSAAPLVELDKQIIPTLLKLLQWGLAGFKGSNQIEGVMDQAIKLYTEKAAQPEQEKPDPAMLKAQADIQKTQMEMQQSKEEHQADMQMQREKMQMEMEQSKQEFDFRMMEMQQKFQLEMKKLEMEMQAKVQEQQAQFAFDSAGRQVEVQQKREMGQMEIANKKESATIDREAKTHAAAVQMVSDTEKAKTDSRAGKPDK